MQGNLNSWLGAARAAVLVVMACVGTVVFAPSISRAATPPPPVFVNDWGGPGGGQGTFGTSISDIAATTQFIYVADTGNNQVQRFDLNGNFQTQWGSGGSKDGEFDGPTGIAT